MKHFLLAMLLIISHISFAQKTPEELGEITFDYFKKNKLDSFFTLIPTLSEFGSFAKAIGIDTTSTHYREFVASYPLVVKNFKVRCVQLLTDSASMDFSWQLAKLEKIEKSQEALPLDNIKPDSKLITITIIDVYFSNANKQFILTLGDAAFYNGVWKPGNDISITQLQ